MFKSSFIKVTPNRTRKLTSVVPHQPLFSLIVRHMAADDGEKVIGPWLVGVLLTIGSALISTCGLLLQKYAHMKQTEREEQGETYKVVLGIPCNGYFILGFLVLVFVPLPLDFIALSQAGQSLIVPVGTGCTVVFGQILAPAALKEKLSRIDMYATVMITIGVVLSTAFGSHATPTYPARVLISMLSDAGFLFMLIFSVLLLAACLALVHSPKEIADRVPLKFQIISMAFIPAMLGSLQMMFFKVIGELTKNSMVGVEEEEVKVINGTSTKVIKLILVNEFLTFEVYLFGIIVIFLAIFQIVYMNQGLKHYNAIKFLPVYNTLLLLSSSVVGSVYFKEYDFYHPVAFPLGVFCISVGITLLSWKSEKIGSPQSPAVHPINVGEVRKSTSPLQHPPTLLSSDKLTDMSNEMSPRTSLDSPTVIPLKGDRPSSASPPNSANKPTRKQSN